MTTPGHVNSSRDIHRRPGEQLGLTFPAAAASFPVRVKAEDLAACHEAGKAALQAGVWDSQSPAHTSLTCKDTPKRAS